MDMSDEDVSETCAKQMQMQPVTKDNHRLQSGSGQQEEMTVRQSEEEEDDVVAQPKTSSPSHQPESQSSYPFQLVDLYFFIRNSFYVLEDKEYHYLSLPTQIIERLINDAAAKISRMRIKAGRAMKKKERIKLYYTLGMRFALRLKTGMEDCCEVDKKWYDCSNLDKHLLSEVLNRLVEEVVSDFSQITFPLEVRIMELIDQEIFNRKTMQTLVFGGMIREDEIEFSFFCGYHFIRLMNNADLLHMCKKPYPSPSSTTLSSESKKPVVDESKTKVQIKGGQVKKAEHQVTPKDRVNMKRKHHQSTPPTANKAKEEDKAPKKKEKGEIFNCRSCNREFGTNVELMTHQVFFHGPFLKSHGCSLCKKQFVNEKRLDAHMEKVHKAIVSYKCCKCDAVFRTSNNLLTHFRTTHIQEEINLSVMVQDYTQANE